MSRLTVREIVAITTTWNMEIPGMFPEYAAPLRSKKKAQDALNGIWLKTADKDFHVLIPASLVAQSVLAVLSTVQEILDKSGISHSCAADVLRGRLESDLHRIRGHVDREMPQELIDRVTRAALD